ncbi:Hpt domain-containing protein [Ramlibacter sp.]|uniref:Hpt domain-containing protein n=1 Tax=Ramlibacter sp. TaxID=1917967 RepID=UPI002D3C4304|nr:Hpt domain-containing protein [Ramlibacter sp.]HYD75228.1 Hpt domain-containing protein [Ramlibacter sp.]
MGQLPTDLPGLDVQRGLRQCGGREALYHALLRLYVQHNAGFGDQVRAALQRGDYAAAERMAHTLKGSSSQVGAESVEQPAADLEAALRAQAPQQDVQAVLDRLEPPLSRLLAALAPHLPGD